jgi:hypothetical protein
MWVAGWALAPLWLTAPFVGARSGRAVVRSQCGPCPPLGACSESLPGPHVPPWISPAWKMQALDACGSVERQRAAAQSASDRQPGPISDSALGEGEWVGQQDPGAQCRQLPDDWQKHYALRPLLLETLVDAARFPAPVTSGLLDPCRTDLGAWANAPGEQASGPGRQTHPRLPACARCPPTPTR